MSLEISGRTYEAEEVVVLAGCGKEKREDGREHYAKDLYTSNYFRPKRLIAEAYADLWYILSAKHELLHPYQPVGYYERSLKDLDDEETAEWARRVTSALDVRRDLFRQSSAEAVVVLAGSDYYDPLADALDDLPLRVETPLRGLKFHDQMSWLWDSAPDPNATLDEFSAGTA